MDTIKALHVTQRLPVVCQLITLVPRKAVHGSSIVLFLQVSVGCLEAAPTARRCLITCFSSMNRRIIFSSADRVSSYSPNRRSTNWLVLFLRLYSSSKVFFLCSFPINPKVVPTTCNVPSEWLWNEKLQVNPSPILTSNIKHRVSFCWCEARMGLQLSPQLFAFSCSQRYPIFFVSPT